MAMAMAGVVLFFVLGLLYLTQTLQAGAIEHELGLLSSERGQLIRDLRNQEGLLLRWGSEPFLLDWAQQHGLDQLGGKVRVPGSTAP